MNAFYDWIFFFVFFLPMGVLVAMNLLLHRDFPDIAAAWARLARIDPEERAQHEEVEASNDDEERRAA
jgi:hypothetical protein